MKPTFFSFSFGCRINQAEKETIDRALLASGFSFDPLQPSLYIVNTCSVTQKADREARQLIYQVRRKLPKTKIVVTGCAVTNWQKNDLYRSLPIDLAVDNLNKEFLVKLILARLVHPKGVPGSFHLASYNLRGCIGAQKGSKFLNSGRLLIKIQDGCHRFCSFCIVPYLRGLPKSPKISEIISRIKNSKEDLSEVILTAVNTEAFGRDTGEKFTDLIQSVFKETKIKRLSFGSIHPWSINNDFFKIYKKYLPTKRFVRFFHIPLQSGSNRMLTLMKRGYKREEFIEKLNYLKKLNPLVFIGTDVIVGFLEETDTDFTETYELLKNSPIARFHVFRFSKREQTAAFYLAKRLKEPSDSVKMKRAKILADLSKKKYQDFLQKHVGVSLDSLILEKKFNGLREVLLENQIPAYVRVDDDLVGEIKPVKIMEFRNGILRGRII